jgi:hypothetical protein
MKNQLITLATISFQQTFQVHSNKHHFPQKKSMAATKIISRKKKENQVILPSVCLISRQKHIKFDANFMTMIFFLVHK